MKPIQHLGGKQFPWKKTTRTAQAGIVGAHLLLRRHPPRHLVKLLIHGPVDEPRGFPKEASDAVYLPNQKDMADHRKLQPRSTGERLVATQHVEDLFLRDVLLVFMPPCDHEKLSVQNQARLIKTELLWEGLPVNIADNLHEGQHCIQLRVRRETGQERT
ncbi:uncharacterized protein Tco025E_00032 [Trypanosoma conorhini]|uniref:Uncharacterized protein n=1 Tax=Trypanosoma conorhini TaxID=83891 RepID=A0A3R7P222_9TRYP|nr:uncharacterized protein Tco025E_00032 [Trypanosoma conorhini]RNF27648.1 hypothetical protein Tco025E_00032 [Trypanosoma conorhini]